MKYIFLVIWEKEDALAVRTTYCLLKISYLPMLKKTFYKKSAPPSPPKISIKLVKEQRITKAQVYLKDSGSLIS